MIQVSGGERRPRFRIASIEFPVPVLSLVLLFSAGCKCGSTTAQSSAAAGKTTASVASASHAGVWAGSAPSCQGLPANCGESRKEDCCKSLLAPGGTYYRSYDGVDHEDK